mgnify:CR=1 FL=1
MPYKAGKVKPYSNTTKNFTFNPRAGTMDQPGANPPNPKKATAPKTSSRPKARPTAPKTSLRPKKRPSK